MGFIFMSSILLFFGVGHTIPLLATKWSIRSYAQNVFCLVIFCLSRTVSMPSNAKPEGLSTSVMMTHVMSLAICVALHSPLREYHTNPKSTLVGLSRREPQPPHKESMRTHGNENCGDVMVHGFWQRQVPCVFDMRITDTESRSYCSRAPAKLLIQAEEEKKKKHLDSC